MKQFTTVGTRRGHAHGPAAAWLKAGGAAGGFGMVEVIAAAAILVVGLLATFMTLAVTVQTSALTRGREGAVTLSREITEDARSIPFSQLSNSTVVSLLQQRPGLADSTSAAGWQIARRGITFTVTATVTSLNDTKDGTGALAIKQVTVNVQWTINTQVRSVQEVATMSSAGAALGLSASALTMYLPSVSTAPTISLATVTQLEFRVTSPTGTTNIVWTVNGVTQPWTETQSGTTFTSSMWTISGLSDGTYQVGAQAVDGQGVIGPAVTIPVTLIRNVPSAPILTGAGFNTNFYVGGSATTGAELQWQPNPELNVTGYKVYYPAGTLICTTTTATLNASCGATAWCSTPTACIDLSPPLVTAANRTYQVAATYKDSGGVTQIGQTTSVTLAGTPSTLFTLATTTQNTGTNCTGSPADDLFTTYTPGSDFTETGGQPVFCSPTFAAGATVQSGGTVTAYVANPATTACSVTATENVDGNATGALTTPAVTLTASSGVTLKTLTFPAGQLITLNAGDRLNVTLNLNGAGCGTTAGRKAVLHYAGATYPSHFQTAVAPIDVPNTPASLTVTPLSNGTAALSWPQPTTGAAISMFRIYRDGRNYGNRYAFAGLSNCSAGTCSYTDPSHSVSHQYSVTSVGNATLGSNMAESTGPGAGPVTG